MIDPKLNEIPVANRAAASEQVTGEEAERLRRVSSNLSVHDTISSNADLSVGGRGVDTSGVGAGAGAGAGMTKVSASNASVPDVVPGPSGTGMVPAGSTGHENAVESEEYGHSDLSALAYESWCERGCPEGSPELDWASAREKLRLRRGRAANV